MTPPFMRDRFTWLAYITLAYYAYLQACLGPLVPFLRTELDLSYTLAGLHTSAFAFGLLLAGLTTDRLEARIGRTAVFILGGAGMALGALSVIVAQSSVLTIAGAFLMGYLGAWLLITINASLADHHTAHASTALTEANIFASLGAALIPAMVGFFATLEAIGWRGALALAIGVWCVLFVFLRRVDIPYRAGRKDKRKHDDMVLVRGSLSLAFWAYWVLFLFIVSIEWCIIYWSADFLFTVVGLSAVDSATSVSLYFASNLFSRILFSQLTRRFATQNLMMVAALIAAVGFPIFWLAGDPGLTLVGLFITGFGIGSLFPLTLGVANVVAAENTDVANARISLAVGLAILVAPQVLASLSDVVGLSSAYGIVVLLLAGLLAMGATANRIAQRQALLPD